jgi:hypothetical protein
MLVKAYHEITTGRLGSVLKEGLKQGAKGDKSAAKAILKTDKFLDNHCPEVLKKAGISRQNNVYCYFAYKDGIVDITNGLLKDPLELSQSHEHTLLKVGVDPGRCYVSNLDLYDKILGKIKSNDTYSAQHLTSDYWDQVTRLDNYDHSNGFNRPEILATYDISPSNIEQLTY